MHQTTSADDIFRCIFAGDLRINWLRVQANFLTFYIMYMVSAQELKVNIHTFFKYIYYRSCSMVGIISH